MSHEIVKSISLKSDKVYVTSAANNVRPLYFDLWEWQRASEVFAQEGREAVFAMIGQEVWDGNFHLYRGSKLCNLFLKAREAFPAKLSFMNFDSEIAGKYLGKMVLKLESDISADLTPEVNEMLKYRNNREHILNAAKVKGYNFLNYASEEIQSDREFALEVLKAGGGCAWFDYPVKYRSDKEFAIEALKQNGCFFRNLDESLQRDRELIFLAYQEDLPERRFHEHLPDCIPESVYIKKDTQELDSEFICKLLDLCPSIHLERSARLLTDPQVAKKWCEVGKFFPHSASHLPEYYLKDSEYQKILLERCDTDEKMACLERIFKQKGIVLQELHATQKPSLELQLQKLETVHTKSRTSLNKVLSVKIPER